MIRNICTILYFIIIDKISSVTEFFSCVTNIKILLFREDAPINIDGHSGNFDSLIDFTVLFIHS